MQKLNPAHPASAGGLKTAARALVVGISGRRRLLGLLATLVGAPFAVRGQAARPARIGWMAGVSYAATTHWPVFVGAMQTLGWREGRDYVVEHAPSEGHAERFPAIAAALVQRRVDAIVTAGTPPSLAARDATRATPIPVVFFFVGDPVGSGLVASLARPGGNLTGLGGLGAGLHAKQLELLKEAVPAVRRVAVFHNPELALHGGYQREIEPAAGRLGLELVRVDLRTEQDVDAAFAAVARDKVEAMLILGQPFVFRVGERIAQLALRHRLPVISPILEMARAGALMAYGSRLVDDVARVPYYLDRILKGTRPQNVHQRRVEAPAYFSIFA
jgi:putative ABC transport system substrate-binding protein